MAPTKVAESTDELAQQVAARMKKRTVELDDRWHGLKDEYKKKVKEVELSDVMFFEDYQGWVVPLTNGDYDLAVYKARAIQEVVTDLNEKGSIMRHLKVSLELVEDLPAKCVHKYAKVTLQKTECADLEKVES